MDNNKKDIVAIILTITIALSIIALVGSAAYAVVANTNDWTTTHIKGPNLTSPLATLLGSLLSAMIAGVVGYLTGQRAAKKVVEPVVKQQQQYPPYTRQPEPPVQHQGRHQVPQPDWEAPHRQGN